MRRRSRRPTRRLRLANPQLPASQLQVAGGVTYLGKPYKDYTPGYKRFLPNASLVYQINNKTVLRFGTGWYSDTFNAVVGTSTRPAQNGYSQATTATLSTDSGLSFCCDVGAAANLGSSVPMMNPFPVNSTTGSRWVMPAGNSLGSNILAGQGYTYYPREYSPTWQQRWRIGIQRELHANQVIDVTYNGAYASSPFTRNLSYLPAQYWNFTMARNADADAAMQKTVANPFLRTNFASLQTSNPTLYNYLSTIGFFTNTTVQVQQLLRAYPNANWGLQKAGGFRGKVMYNDIEALYTKRFSKGFQSSVMYTRNWSRQQWVPNQFDQTPAWQPNSNSRPTRFVWTTVWELPFGKGRQLLTHGPLQHVAGGWQLSWIYQYQTGALVNWGNLFYYGDLNALVNALNHDSVHASNIHTWYSPAADCNTQINTSCPATGAIPSGFVGFEGRSAYQPGTYQARMFPQYIDSLRADSIHNWDVRIYRRFTIYERLNLNVSADLMNMTNHTQFAAPNIGVTASTFGTVTGTSNQPRIIQLNMRIDF